MVGPARGGIFSVMVDGNIRMGGGPYFTAAGYTDRRRDRWHPARLFDSSRPATAGLFANHRIRGRHRQNGAMAAHTTSTTTTTTTVSGVPVNPNDPVQFPPAGPGPDSHEGKLKAAFVDQKIAAAKAQGKDTPASETQEVMGQADLRKGMNDEAAQHFDAALRSVGVMPSAPGKDSGEAGSLHHPMP